MLPESWLRFLLALNLLMWGGLSLMLFVSDQAVAGLIAFFLAILAAHTMACVERLFKEMRDL